MTAVTLWAEAHDDDAVPLTDVEQTRLATLEAIVERGQQTFIEVGTALLEIRDERLYRAEHSNFEDYCRARWGWSRGRAYQYMDAAKVVAAVSTTVDAAPANEAQARELVPLLRSEDAGETMGAAWIEAMGRANERKRPVTAEIVREVVDEKREELIGAVLAEDGEVLLEADEQARPSGLPDLPAGEAKALAKIVREAVGIAINAERRMRIAVLECEVLKQARDAHARGERVSIHELWKRIGDAASPENDAGTVLDRARWGWLLDDGLPTQLRDQFTDEERLSEDKRVKIQQLRYQSLMERATVNLLTAVIEQLREVAQ